MALKQVMGDFVVRQKNGAPAYQIASLLDDVHWNINFIVRGNDLINSSAAQMYLANTLAHSSFEQAIFWHHELIAGDDGQKLSKSKGDTAVKTWREQGKAPAPIFKNAAKWLQVEEAEVFDAQSLVSVLQAYQ